MTRKLRTGIFAALTALTLGFGGAQALAAPADADAGARRCDPEACDRRCLREFGVLGFCDGRGCWCRS